ncbi:MAG: dihydrolipoyl dehydrogenase [Candidatus Heimdallarchaeota archaeon]|nr:dihydrolipoyl dehydrogenase [Candidatus Heimdallarchaeota archaeon]
MQEVDVLVIGAGPGGYPAAIRASQLGKSVLIVDKGNIGGECLNWGCIPSKALISAANFYHKLSHQAKEMGIYADNVHVNMKELVAWKQSIQDTLITGIKQLLKSNKVDLKIGTISFTGSNTAKINESEEIISFSSAIIATGASFISIPGFEIDEERILSSKGLLSLEEVPEELVCIGGGIIGLELGTVFAKLGSKVKIVELLPQLMTGVEKRLVNVVKKKLTDMGVEIYLNSMAKSLTRGEKLELQIDTNGEITTITADKILLSIGKRASTSELGLETIGVETDNRGFIKVDEQMRTNLNHIYAIGDCTGMPFLAHRATKQGIVAAEVLGGLDSSFNYDSIPGAIFTDPEIAFIGISENEAKEQGINVVVGQASFAGSGRALSQQEGNGFVRIISNADTKAIIGIEMVGPHVSDLISEASLAYQNGLTPHNIGETIHPHPTLPEMFLEAAEAIEQKAIHVPNARIRKKK